MSSRSGCSLEARRSWGGQIADTLIEPGFFFVGMQMEFTADGCSCTAEVLARNQGLWSKLGAEKGAELSLVDQHKSD